MDAPSVDEARALADPGLKRERARISILFAHARLQ
jgi:hypothetical protein